MGGVSNTHLNINLSKLNNVKNLIVEIDVLENDIIEKYPKVLETLVQDNTTQQNVLFTDNS